MYIGSGLVEEEGLVNVDEVEEVRGPGIGGIVCGFEDIEAGDAHLGLGAAGAVRVCGRYCCRH